MLASRNSVDSATAPAAEVGRSSPRVDGTCWMLTEGAAGMVSQVTGLANAVGLPTVRRDITLRLPWRKLWPGLIPLLPGIFAAPLLGEETAAPRLVISCGRQGAVGSLALKKWLQEKVFTVHIQDPRVSPARFDMIVTPEHDGLSGDNVVHSLGAVHHVTPEKLRAARQGGLPPQWQGLGADFVAVILGGPNRYYGYSVGDVDRLISQLQELTRASGCHLAVIPSRRTPAAVVSRFAATFPAPHAVWQGGGSNPYMAVLAMARHIVVTGDSVSMISEAAATGRPVSVFQMTERRRAKRFRRFHESFQQAGVTRPFTGRLEDWSYQSPDRTDAIAGLIRQRIGLGDERESRAALSVQPPETATQNAHLKTNLNSHTSTPHSIEARDAIPESTSTDHRTINGPVPALCHSSAPVGRSTR